MLLDFEVVGDPELDTSERGRPDVCIVGAGAAGILIATQLAAQGLKVLLLEAGGLDLEARSQAIYDAQATGLPYRGATQGRFRTYGGSTTQWGGQILELEDFDFDKREHVAGSGWPFPKIQLKDYYERALRFEGLRLVERDDAKVWAGLGLSICDLGPEFRMEYSRWCPERDFAVLQSNTLRNSKRLRVLYHANVVGFQLNDAKTSIEALQVRGYDSRQVRVSADHYIFATGAIEAVRLLLQPLQTGTAPWQHNGLLGKHYQDHISLNRIPIRDIATRPASAYFGYATLSGFRYHNKILLSAAEQIKARSLNIAGTIGPFRRESPSRDAASVALREIVRKGRRPSPTEWASVIRHLPSLAAETASRTLFGEEPEWKKTMLTIHCEQSPLSTSSIRLSEERDALGLLKAKINWEISAQEIYSLRNYAKRASEVFAARRFAKIQTPKGFFDDDAVVLSMCSDSNHHMGGARMSASARQGIVDTNLKLHGIDNGYLCSSAVFPCSGFSNPTHTLLALGMRLVDHLQGETGKGDGSVSLTTERPSPIQLVSVGSSGKALPQLGFGCSYLLGPGLDRAKSLRLLETAYDAGIRYFDTARLYGQGKGEALLGEFLRHHSDVIVGTKFGIEPPTYLQRAATAIGRRSGFFTGAAKALRGSGKVRFNAANARASLERSLRALGREEVEIFLLHEPDRMDLVNDDLLQFLEEARSAGKIGNYGIGGEYSLVTELYATRRNYTRVLQFEHSIFGPHLQVPEAFRIHYRTFAKPAAAFAERMEGDKSLCWWWSEMVGMNLREPSTQANLLLRAALDESPGAMTLFSASSEEHIYECAGTATNQVLSEPAGRLRKLLIEDDLGIGKQLYGSHVKG